MEPARPTNRPAQHGYGAFMVIAMIVIRSMRRGLRRFADDVLTELPPGWSLQGLISSLEDVEDLPTDLAERHDTYLYGGGKSGRVGTD